MSEYIFKIAIYLGLIGFILLIFSFLTGMKIIKPKPKLKLHRKIGIFGFILASIHALVMIYYYYFS